MNGGHRNREKRVTERVEIEELMPMGGPERSKALHNFATESWLKWGNQKHLKCVKVDSKSSTSEKPEINRRSSNSSPSIRDQAGAAQEHGKEDGEIEAGKAKVSNLKEDKEEKKVEEGGKRPGKMRTRRAATNVKSTKFEEKRVTFSSPPRSEPTLPKSMRGKGVPGNGNNGGGESSQERQKFSLTLSKKEIEEDYMKMFGEKPPRRPKRRPKPVQKQLDMVFPGSWLSEVTPEMYKVSEEPDQNGKK